MSSHDARAPSALWLSARCVPARNLERESLMRFSLPLKASLAAFLLIVLASGAPLRADDPAPDVSFGKSVTLHFEIEGTGEHFSVMTAKPGYALTSEETRDSRVESGTVPEQKLFDDGAANVPPVAGAAHSSDERISCLADLKGDVLIDEGGGAVLVTCAGSFQVSRSSLEAGGEAKSNTLTEVNCRFDASARLTPGATHVLARSGDTGLLVRIEISE